MITPYQSSNVTRTLEIKGFEEGIEKKNDIAHIVNYCKFNMEFMEKSVIIFGLRMLAASRCWCWCKIVVSRHMEFLLLRWLDNVLDWQNPLPHTGHLNGFSLTWMYLEITYEIELFASVFVKIIIKILLNLLWKSCRVSYLWSLKWSCLRNALPHTSHG